MFSARRLLGAAMHHGLGRGNMLGTAAKVAGVARVRVADAAHYEHQLAENLAPLLVSLARVLRDLDFWAQRDTSWTVRIAPDDALQDLPELILAQPRLRGIVTCSLHSVSLRNSNSTKTEQEASITAGR